MLQARWDAERFASSEDRRMWRLLLAPLHPDAGGDHDLFAFACAVREMSPVARCEGARIRKNLRRAKGGPARGALSQDPSREVWHWSSSANR